MNRKVLGNIAHILIWLLGFFGLNGTFSLVKEEYTYSNICPKLLGIPACYFILTCLILILISHAGWLKDRLWLFRIGAGIAVLIALFGSVGQIFGWLECPKTEGGIPMCYLSLGMFFGLIFLKILERNIFSQRIRN